MSDGASEASLQVLTADECYLLLATQQVGRLGVNAERYRLIFPVNYGLDRGVIVIRTDPGDQADRGLPRQRDVSRWTRSISTPAPAGACWSGDWPKR